jgi:protein-S-isoprenylcysteine O-methyltransferase Ste14
MGLVLIILGLVFLTLARLQLGNSFSWDPQAKNLVTTGLYSRIRNPVYVFGGVTVFGLILYVQRPWWCVALAAVAVMQFIRARAEARVLEEKFGDDYRRWRAQTWF